MQLASFLQKQSSMADQDLTHNFELAKAYYQTLLATERISSDKLKGHQRDVASTFLQHVDRHMPFYRERLNPIRRPDGSYNFDQWHEVPILTKADIKSHAHHLQCPVIPKEHGQIVFTQSSASTGTPLRIPSTQLTGLATACASYRHLKSQNIDWSYDLAFIRAFRHQPPPFDGASNHSERWGPAWLPEKERGHQHPLSVLYNPKFQLNWLAELEPVYVNTIASNIMRLVRTAAEGTGKLPEIKAFLSVGETVTDDLREQCREHLGCEIIDVLATSECGTIAVQCPVSGGYHIQSELAIVEILNDDGKPSAYGQPGRVVVTPLFNLAMPLIRYQFEDYVTLAEPCPCGRPAPLIGKILGRRSNLFTFADGTFGQLNLSSSEMAHYLGTSRWQVVQAQARTAEVHYMTQKDSGNVDEAAAVDYVRKFTGDNVAISCRRVPALGPSPAGKFPMLRNLTVNGNDQTNAPPPAARG